MIGGSHAPCDLLETMGQGVEIVVVGSQGLGKQMGFCPIFARELVGKVNGVAIAAQIVVIASVADGGPCAIYIFANGKVRESGV